MCNAIGAPNRKKFILYREGRAGAVDAEEATLKPRAENI